MGVVLGVDQIEEFADEFCRRNIGLITNYSGVTSDWKENIEVLFEMNCPVKKIFTPEHGLYGCPDGETVKDDVYGKYNIPIISLFGEKKKPSLEDLESLDLLIYDIQDVGLRYYTFIYTLEYCLEAAAEAGITFIVLDRPDPLGAGRVSGGIIEKKYESFVGGFGLPLRYGMTAGELGYYFIKYSNLNLDYRVIEMKNYSRDSLFDESKMLWNVPSPALPCFSSVICYEGGCFFESTNISEGRGTARPFQMYGAPFIDSDLLYEKLHNVVIDYNFAVRKRAFIPQTSKYAGELCYGVEFAPLSGKSEFLPVALILLKLVKDYYPEDFKMLKGESNKLRINELSGSEDVARYLNNETEFDAIRAKWDNECIEFCSNNKDILLYTS